MRAKAPDLPNDSARKSTEWAALTDCPIIPPLSVRKVPFRMVGDSRTDQGKVEARLTLIHVEPVRSTSLDQAELTIRVRTTQQTYKRTFLSEIDGSVQYYAVRPAQPMGDAADRPAMFLTLHGAGVEALGQASSYSAKSWGHVVAPTNRRKFGFDWEDWGRLDALEVLNLASRELNIDPSRIYLTGHSMGGHGTWSLGATFCPPLRRHRPQRRMD